ncbi:ROK family protein [Lactobacillus sp. ESL0703]|uniref:ROK family protein n=1 Tax=Lactobacillus sp. ESL0703 TaxID=2983218 RepID=UPI0023F89091|nr:ROK family protein [Lactobacillus sp. ESL0703]MDF7669102.1 ROK family protein [Lactobacillus sp. ESL0703]
MRVLLGIDIGGTTTKLGFISETGTILKKWSLPTIKTNNEFQMLDAITASYKNETEHDFILSGVGIGVPGSVNPQTMAVYDCNNLGWHDNIDIASYVSSNLNTLVRVENDANVAALGEIWRGSCSSNNILYVTLGTGVGAGIVLNGKLVSGSLGAAGELGHVIVDPNGFMCSCGNRGCLETVASATGIVRLYKHYSKNSISKTTAEEVFNRAKSGEQISLEAVDTACDFLGLGIANTVNLLNLEEVIIGGGVSAAGEFLRNKIQNSMNKYLYLNNKEHVQLKLASLGNDAGILGAAYLVKK